MFVVVTGGSGSGKSEYAENRVLAFNDPLRFYVATMQSYDAESEARIARHRKLRAGKGFETVERQLDLKNLDLSVWKQTGTKEHGRGPGGEAGKEPGREPGTVSVLLECVSNLAANEMFDPAGAGENALDEIELGIDRLLEQCDNLVAVTNEIFSDGVTYSPETQAYQDLLGKINRYMVARADEAVEVVCGIPVCIRSADGPKQT